MKDAALNAALDQFTMPPPRPDLVARILAASVGAEPASRPARRPWARTRNIVAGTMAFSLMSATAAAAGLFGGNRIHIPVISTLVASAEKAVAPEKPKRVVAAKPKPAPEPEKPTLPEAEPAEFEAPALPLPEAILATREAKREVRATHLADRMERRLSEIEKQRAARNLPPRPEVVQRRALLEQLKVAKTDEERKIALQAIRANNLMLKARAEERQRKRAELGLEPLTPAKMEERAKRRAELRERWRQRQLAPSEALSTPSEPTQNEAMPAVE